MTNFLDNILKLPRKIDFIHYSPLSGGDFFTTMIINSHEHTKNIANNFSTSWPKSFVNKKIKHLDNKFQIKINEDNKIIFGKPQYKNLNFLRPTWKIIEKLSMDETIDLYKYSILNAILSTSPTNFKESLYNDSIILIADHFIMSNSKMKCFSEYSAWNVLSIDPEDSRGINVLDAMNKKLNICTEEFQKQFINKYPFLEKFPFLDYILNEDYNIIKYWIENRYGSDLDFDFIDKSLRMWKKVRVDPYL
jgi:hypothetical protein